jgi:RHS repeat-associated protein
MVNTTRRLFWTALIVLLAPAFAFAQDEVVYYHTDAIGSVRMVTDASGAVVARYDYLPFGERWETAPPNTNPDVRQFTGKARDAETGLDYFGARYMRAQSGRFLTVDPRLGVDVALLDPQRWNRYSYVGNRPTRVVDPDGRGWLSVLFKVGKAAFKGGSVASEFGGAVDDVQTLLSDDSSLAERGLAAASLASEVWSPVSLGDARAIGTFAVQRGDDVLGLVRRDSGFRNKFAKVAGAVEEGAHAHHVLPIRFGRQFANAGLDVNDGRYGAWWKAQDHLRNAKGYNEQWATFFRQNPNPSSDQVLQFGRDLAATYGLKILF